MILTSFLAAMAIAGPGDPTPRETVRSIAEAIREVYFDAGRAEGIAAELESEAQSGAYDGFENPLELASALTARLKPEDAHFFISYDPETGADEEAVELPISFPQGPYGFQRVEILSGNVGYIDLRYFASIDFTDPNDPGRRTADSALAFVQDTDAVIIDVRHNGGGEPAMVGYLVSAFVPPDADVYNAFIGRGAPRTEEPNQHFARPRANVPVFILTSARTGSAGEALPYTLQAAGRATVVGEATAGAANPGEPLDIGNGFTAFVSDATPRNPITQGNWEGTGVVPDVSVPWDNALAEAHRLALQGIVVADPARQDAVWLLAAMAADYVPDALALYEGQYGAGFFGDHTIAVRDGTLTVLRGRRPPQPLKPLGPDLFYTVSDPTHHYRFNRDSGGAIESMNIEILGGPQIFARRTQVGSS